MDNEVLVVASIKETQLEQMRRAAGIKLPMPFPITLSFVTIVFSQHLALSFCPTASR